MKRRRRNSAFFLLMALLISNLNFDMSYAVEYGKIALKQRIYVQDDSPLIHSVGILRKNFSGRVGVASSFIPYFYLGVNKGLPRVIDATKYSGILGFKVTDPNGKEITFTKNFQEIAGVGTISEEANARVIQSDPTYGKTVTFIPNFAGSYLIKVWHDFNENGSLDSDETFTTDTQTFVDNSELSLSIVNFGKIVGGFSADSIGILTRVCLLNGSLTTNLQPTSDFEGQQNPKQMEQILVTSNSTTEVIDAVSKWSNGIFSMSDDANSASYILTNENFNNVGCAYINHFNTAATPGLVSLTFKGFGPSLSNINVTTSNNYLSSAIYPISLGRQREVVHSNNLNTSYSSLSSKIAPPSGDTATAINVYTAINSSGSVTISSTTDPGVPNVSRGTILTRVIDVDGKYTGLKNASFIYSLTSAINASDLTVSNTFTATLGEIDSYKIYIQGTDSLLGGNLTGSVAITVQTQTRAPKILEGKILRAHQEPGTTEKYQVGLKDQFGSLMPNTEVKTIVSGRNSITNSVKVYKTSSTGYFDFILEDKAKDSAETLDLITGLDISDQKLAGKGLIVDFGNYNSPTKVTLSGAATEEKIPGSILNYIDTSVFGASNALVPIKAAVSDANGNRVPAGVPVYWEISGLDSAASIYVDKDSGNDWTKSFTDANGEAFTYVYSISPGDVTVIANTGKIKSENKGVIHFTNSPTDLRTISISKGDGFFRAHAEDRYGNPIKGVELVVKKISGKGKIPFHAYYPFTSKTDEFGNIEFEITEGQATFSISTTVDKYGQTNSEAGYVNEFSISSTSVGANLAPKGVGNLTVDVDSKDITKIVFDAAKNAKNASDKAKDVSNAAVIKVDNALKTSKETKLSIVELSTKISKQLNDLGVDLNSILKSLTKIQKKVG